MTGILKDFSFAIAYLDGIIILSRMAEEHLTHIKQVFERLRNAHLLMKLSKCHFFTKEIQYFRHFLSIKSIRPLPSKTQAINNMYPPKQLNKYAHSWVQEIYQKPCQDGQAIDTLNLPKTKFEWTPIHHTAFLTLKKSVIQASILCYPNLTK